MNLRFAKGNENTQKGFSGENTKGISSMKKILTANKNGFVLMTAIFVMAILAVFGTIGIYLAATDVKIAQNYKMTKQKFYAAEAALERGVNILRSTPTENWKGHISDSSSSKPEAVLSNLENIQFHGMKYTVLIKNNLDDPVFADSNYTEDKKYSTDTDDTLVIIGEGHGSSGWPKRIEAAVKSMPVTPGSYGGKNITMNNISVTAARITW
ncbi:pilus assembly PilX N-terminal domain-containing protein [bacterium]|nr:pilus assembly PilX N-terminal domain-containing protein [bacterium]